MSETGMYEVESIREPHFRTGFGLPKTKLADLALSLFPVGTSLEIGSGDGEMVRYLRDRNVNARGIDNTDWTVNNTGDGLVRKGILTACALDELPYPDRFFDLVCGFNVIENYPDVHAELIAKELVRVAKRWIFMTICLRPSTRRYKEPLTLRSRSWWEAIFRKAGAVPSPDVIRRLQKKQPGATVEQVLRCGPAKNCIEELAWFHKNPPFDLCGELEPWFFVFRV